MMRFAGIGDGFGEKQVGGEGVPAGCLPLFIFMFMVFFLPLLFVDALGVALQRLGLGPELSLWVIVGIFLGGLVNVPVKRIQREESFDVSPWRFLGISRLVPSMERQQPYTLVAVNVGGCVIPLILAVYQLFRLAIESSAALGIGIAGVVLNTVVCYMLARPVPKVGIAMPALVPAAVAAFFAMITAYEIAPLVAFSSGVLGPLIGADLLHLRDFSRLNTGVVSIGGAGTFDGIVISGLIAALLV